MAGRRWLKGLGFAVIMLGALGLGYLVLDLALHRWVRSEESFVVPSLEGLSRGEAYERCAEWGLLMEESPAEFDAWLPAGYVLRQRPAAPSQVKPGRRVKVVLSAGPRLEGVPDLRGASERQARLSLEDRGLVIGHWMRARGSLPAGSILATRPSGGTRLPRGSRVDILISEGESGPGLLLPDLRGMALARVSEDLEAAGLAAPRLRYRQETGAPEGRVLEQNPPAGSRLDEGAELELVVASGS